MKKEIYVEIFYGTKEIYDDDGNLEDSFGVYEVNLIGSNEYNGDTFYHLVDAFYHLVDAEDYAEEIASAIGCEIRRYI